jgi:hypothetical protein
MTTRLPNTTISVIASLALVGGPAVWAAQAESMERLARKDAEAKKRARIATESTDTAPSNTEKNEKRDSKTAGLVAPSAAKPADTDSSSLSFCLTSSIDDIPGAALRSSADAMHPVIIVAALHCPSYRAHAPPVQLN